MDTSKTSHLAIKLIIALVVLAVVGMTIGFIILEEREKKIEEGGVVSVVDDGGKEALPSEILPVDFAKIGYTTLNNSGQKNGVLYLIYEEPGAPALSKELKFDYESICGSESGSEQCIALNIPFVDVFKEKRVLIKGIKLGDAVLVRLLRVVGDLDGNFAPTLGELIVSWPTALRFIENDDVGSLSQKHNLEVGLLLKDGRKIATLEPTIDTVISVHDRVSDKCGSVPIATE
ncbi:MAG TPA: hypothetical protein DEP11_01395 [Candidatus Jacksonbacteria bacterium]|nr:hypothetical protein [Candidatus Jacksonbacteria bacterium]